MLINQNYLDLIIKFNIFPLILFNFQAAVRFEACVKYQHKTHKHNLTLKTTAE